MKTNKLTAYQIGFMDGLKLLVDIYPAPIVVNHRHTLTLKSMERKGYINIAKYRMAKDHKHYETVINVTL